MGFPGYSDMHLSLRAAVLNDCFLHFRFLPSASSARQRRSLRFPSCDCMRGALIPITFADSVASTVAFMFPFLPNAQLLGYLCSTSHLFSAVVAFQGSPFTIPVLDSFLFHVESF